MTNSYYKIVLIDSTTGSTGNYAELDTEGIDFTSTFQVADIADISSRKDAITQTLTFKATKNNNIVFGNLSNLNHYVDDSVNLSFLFNFNITKDIPCQVFENNILIFQGVLHFISANKDTQNNITYECSIKGYMVDFFSKIKDKLISNLSFSAFTHTYNIDNIRNSWSNVYIKNGVQVTGDTSTGYKYAMIDYGANVTDDTAFDNMTDYRNFRPAFTMTEYFNAIFSQTGLTDNYRYTITGSTAFVEEFNKLIVPNNDSDFSYTAPASVIFEVAANGIQLQYNGKNQTHYDSANHRTEYNRLIGFNSVVTGSTGQTLINPALVNGQIIKINNGINTTITASVSYASYQSLGSDVSVKFQCLYRTDSTKQFGAISEVDKEYKFTGSTFSVQTNDAFTLNLSVNQQLDAGSELAFVVYLDGKNVNAFAINIYKADVKIGSPLSTSQVTINLGDEAILVGQNTQSINQVDFLKSVIQMFNLYVYSDPEDSKHIIFTPYNDYYSNFTAGNIVSTALDWTKKIDNNSSFKQTPVSDIFNLYTFNFKDDTDFYSKYYKDKYGLTYGNLTLTGTTNGQDKSIDLIFGSTPVAAYNGRNVPALWELDTNNLKKEKVTVPRLLFFNGLKNCTTYEIGIVSLNTSNNTYVFSSIDLSDVSGYTFSQYAEANEYTLSSDFEFVDLTFGTPYEVFYTNGGVITNFGSGKKNLYDRYYADQISELTDSNTRIIELSAYLNEGDIQNLDFRRPIYFNSVLGHNYFKLLSVQYSSNSQLSTIKLQTAYIKDNEVTFAGYQNNTYSAFIKKNDCSSGYTGEALYYLVPAATYTSFVSQADADSMAANEAATSGQTFANHNGVCVNIGVTFNLGFADYPTDAYTMTGRTNYVTNTGTLNTGSILFTYAGGNAVRNIGSYYANDTYYYETDSTSAIFFSGTTASLSATTYDAYFTSGSSQFTSCSIANDGSTIYSHCRITDPTPRVSTSVMYLSGGTVSNGYYSDGSNAYLVSGGTITDVFSCNAHPVLIS